LQRNNFACHRAATLLPLTRHEWLSANLRGCRKQGLGCRQPPFHARPIGRAILSGPCSEAAAAGFANRFTPRIFARAAKGAGQRPLTKVLAAVDFDARRIGHDAHDGSNQ
jgi:hypothetical protein